ncbi:hypothetical protein C2S53_020155 [Perilla frutescens var. hirtella]|uniref:Uncharacterized protein n=1 Tax=Perilla frutescens var. hirtella TaxID=608512 RepID=A0AAD4ILL0_PERFH|nr:hypothetical protein C2S53_020155 [Perilla frutescens var. hirtella]
MGALYKLFGEYARVCSTPLSSKEVHTHSQVHPMISRTSSSSISDPEAVMYNEFVEELRQMTSNEGKSELDIYLDEKIVEVNVDVLKF